jgi:hypothetical protein
MKREIWKIGVLGLGVWLCAAPMASAQVIVRTAPPMVREAPPPPRAGFVWDPTHYDWQHGAYVRTPGRYIPARRGFVWVPGRWEFTGGGYRWIDGRWRPRM